MPIKRITSDKDIEPVSLALLILGGISAIGTLAGVGLRYWERRQKREEIERRAENHLFEATRQLNRLKTFFDEFCLYIEKYNYHDATFGIGRAPIVDTITTSRFRQLRREITRAGDSFAKELEELTALLGDSQRVDKVRSLILDLDTHFSGMRGVKTYGDYFMIMDSLIDKTKQVLREVGQLYGIRIPNSTKQE